MKMILIITFAILFLMGLTLVMAEPCPEGIEYCNPDLPFNNPTLPTITTITSGNGSGSSNYSNYSGNSNYSSYSGQANLALNANQATHALTADFASSPNSSSYWTTDTTQTGLIGNKTGYFSMNFTQLMLSNSSYPNLAFRFPDKKLGSTGYTGFYHTAGSGWDFMVEGITIFQLESDGTSANSVRVIRGDYSYPGISWIDGTSTGFYGSNANTVDLTSGTYTITSTNTTGIFFYRNLSMQNNSILGITYLCNTSGTCFTLDVLNKSSGGSNGTTAMDYTNIAMLNLSNNYLSNLLQNFSNDNLSTTGFVSIGTSNNTYGYRLLVSDGVKIANSSVFGVPYGRMLSVQGNGSAFIMVRDTFNNIEYLMGTSVNNEIFLGSATNHNVSFRTNNNNRITIDTNGNTWFYKNISMNLTSINGIDKLCNTTGSCFTLDVLNMSSSSTGSSYNVTYDRLLNQNCANGYVHNGTYSNGTYICTQFNVSALTNLTRILGQNCASGQVVNGTYVNGTYICTAVSATSTYNATYNTLLNQNCPSGQVVNGTYTNGTFKCTAVTATSIYNSTYDRLLNQNCPSGQVLNGTYSNGTFKCTAGTGTSAGGSDTQIQFNNNSKFAGSPNFVYYDNVSGTELTTNGNFNGNSYGWNLQAPAWVYGGNKLNKIAGIAGYCQQNSPYYTPSTAGETLQVNFTISNYSGSGAVYISYGGDSYTPRYANGVYSETRVFAGGGGGINLVADTAVGCAISNVSIRRVTGVVTLQGRMSAESYRIGYLDEYKSSLTPVPGTVFKGIGSRTWVTFQPGSQNQFTDLQLIENGYLESGGYYNDYRIGYDMGNHVLTTLGEGTYYQAGVPMVFQALSNVATGGNYYNQLKLFTNGNILMGGTDSYGYSDTSDNGYNVHIGKNLFVNNEGVFGGKSNCQGTIVTSDCTTYPDESSCIANQNHGGCSWTANTCDNAPALDCSIYNEADCNSRTYCLASYTDTCVDNPVINCAVDEGTCNSLSPACSNNGHHNAWSYCSDTSGYGCFNYNNEADCTNDPNGYGGCQNNYVDVWDGCSVAGGCSSMSYASCPTSYGCSQSHAYASCSNNGDCTSIPISQCNSYNGCNDSYHCIGNADCSGITNSLTDCNNEDGCNWTTPQPNLILTNNGVPSSQNMSIGNDGINMRFDTYNGVAYFSGNISATGFITRTSVYDKSEGTALSKINDASYYLTTDKATGKQTIDDTKFYGNVKMQMPDTSKPVDVQQCDEKKICDKIKLAGISLPIDNCKVEKTNCITKTTYPNNITIQGDDLVKEVGVLKQSIFELKSQNEDLQKQIDSLNGNNQKTKDCLLSTIDDKGFLDKKKLEECFKTI